MATALVFGASGQIGRFLIPRLLARGDRVIAASRQPPQAIAQNPALIWQRADLFTEFVVAHKVDVIYSLGPLDAFSHWFARADVMPATRVIAISSMSAQSKQNSIDPLERALAQTLRDAEARVFAAARERHIACTLLRPTLIYGAGVDRSIAPIARFARRRGIFPLLVGANGMRQPVHADDLAAACADVAACTVAYGRTYAVGGGERLSFSMMLARTREQLPRWTLPVPVPVFLLRLLAPLAARFGISAISRGAMLRLREDLLADNTEAVRDFSYTPRKFLGAEVLRDP